jgi:hypothetical protein
MSEYLDRARVMAAQTLNAPIDRGASMIRRQLGVGALWLAAFSTSIPALAQSRGRTDGPEGSEYGKGGYSRLGGEQFSLAFDWGASIEADNSKTPLFVGLTASYWSTDWFLLDFSSAYLLSSKRYNILLGPRFRSITYPVSLSIGLKAGPIFLQDGGVRFGLSPQIGGDLLLERRIILGLGYAPDIPLGSGGVAHRIFMTLGYRF